MEIDNSFCSADISSISVSIGFKVGMKSNGAVTADYGTVIKKNLKGLPAGHMFTGESAIREAFNLHSTQ